jgi:ribosomal protein S18 acetylase RimI-like enzyme
MVVIQLARSEDAKALGALHVQTWRETYRGVMPDAFLDGLSPERRAVNWRRQLCDPKGLNRIFVAEEASTLIGFCSVGPPRHDVPEATGEIRAIYVLKNAQRKGLGRHLLCAGAKELWSLEFKDAALWVAAANAQALFFYQKMGGVLSGRRTVPFSGFALDEVEYRLPLAALVQSHAQVIP